jgi:serine protease Do
MKLRLLLGGLFLAAFILVHSFTATPALAQRQIELKSGVKFRDAFRDVIAKAGKSTVRVQCQEKDKADAPFKDVALGVVVSTDGFILTKASDLAGKINVKLKGGAVHEARLVGVNEKHDLAMLKINVAGLTPVEWSDSKVDQVGNFVASVGTSELPVAVGVISVGARALPATNNPSPVVDPNSGYLGVGADDNYNGKGFKVGQVLEKSAAKKAKIKISDVIVGVGDRPVDSWEALSGILQRYKAGDTVVLKVLRGEEEMELEVKLGKRPMDANRSDMQNMMGSKLSKRIAGFPVVLQHDSVINPEDCGGPLVDLDGRVIGINISRAGRVETYAIPSEAIRPLLSDMMSGKQAPKG